ncbi:noncanonical pyrimidine nucleotidase, YjjG family [Marinilabiliaceae bacterium JC017]|nr:noncanonical pyrimidine nucleotidase, YjjG family [Marinilabiliaceae bacterium JC017]
MKYRHIFFDLDHTLWDFKTNSLATLQELFVTYKLSRVFDDFDSFHEKYEKHNLRLWNLYRRGKVTRQALNFDRFYLPFSEAGFDDPVIAGQFGKDYLAISPTKTKLMPYTLELLNYLKAKYTLHIITNGFREVQERKLEMCGIRPYFNKVFISDLIGVQKPNIRFFEYAVKSTNARKKESLVVGDSLEVDIAGAQNYGLDHVFFNSKQISHEKKVMLEISSLKQLFDFL